ncbi:hypothetical protein DH2020_026481 [Rehmannia glutinosa]|uniref:Uncharacterized protein n=1 Tax=Rehmannia glutinosa TaxID=99300 RepID=A0ABR0VX02_REHGL
MFGKNATENEQISDDEDWGPRKRKRKVKETDAASTLMTLGETEKRNSEESPSELKERQLIKKIKRPIFRLPHNAVDKLRLVFAENELPARALRVSLAKQLGLEFEKAGRSQEDVSPSIQKESISETAKGDNPDQMASRDDMSSENPKSLKLFVRRRNTHLLTDSFKIKQRRKPLLQTADCNQMNVDLGDDVSLKHLREKAKEAKKKLNCKSRGAMLKAESEMERLCEIKSRVEKLQQVLLEVPSWRFGKSRAINKCEPSVIFVPVAELREKR